MKRSYMAIDILSRRLIALLLCLCIGSSLIGNAFVSAFAEDDIPDITDDEVVTVDDYVPEDSAVAFIEDLISESPDTDVSDDSIDSEDPVDIISEDVCTEYTDVVSDEQGVPDEEIEGDETSESLDVDETDEGIDVDINGVDDTPIEDTDEGYQDNDADEEDTPDDVIQQNDYILWLSDHANYYSVLYKILYEDFDPYSSTMSMGEFRELMLLFELNILPLNTSLLSSTYSLVEDTAVSDGIIPRDMFYLSGLPESITEGFPSDGVGIYPQYSWEGFKAGSVYTDTGDVKMSSDITDTNYFPRYSNEHYITKITAEGIEASILGVVKNPYTDLYVFYYLSSDQQDSAVSTTTLAEGKKFVINYFANEKEISYKVELDGEDVTGQYAGQIFGGHAPTKTNYGAYSFDVVAPYGYEVEIFLEINGVRGTDRVVGVSKNPYPIGMEPVYTGFNGNTMTPNTSAGPAKLILNETFTNDSVDSDRTVVAVMTKKPTPVFDPSYWVKTVHASGRGCAGTDKGWNGTTFGTGNIQPEASNWQFVSKSYEMSEGSNGYNFVWTFQTNTGESFILDSLAVNGQYLNVPFKATKIFGTLYDSDDVGVYTPGATSDPYEPNLKAVEGQSIETTILDDGTKITVELVRAWRSNNCDQRVYTITITGAHSNIVITGGNLMMSKGGAAEVSVYNLIGIHADDGFDPSNSRAPMSPAIQFYSKDTNGWKDMILADVIVGDMSYDKGDTTKCNANIRFKVLEGYDMPYYFYDSLRDGIIEGQASATRNKKGDVISSNPILSFDDATDGVLDSQHIYTDGDWYYIRVTTQGNYKIALLTVGSVTEGFVVRYVPYSEEVPNPENMPKFYHTDDCHPSFKGDSSVDGIEYDDNWSYYYNIVSNNIVSISPIVPDAPNEDIETAYVFVDWVLVDNDGSPILIDGEELHVSPGNTLDIRKVWQYANENPELGGYGVVVKVLNLMPTWKKVTNPFRYRVVLNWVDYKGVLHEESFSDYWKDVITEGPEKEGNGIVVYVNKNAEPLRDWMSQNPTYQFWDDVNTAITIDDISRAIDKGFTGLDEENKPSADVFDSGSEFRRLGNYAYHVANDGGTIVIWMIENRGGLVFRKEVRNQPLISNDCFYFTVTDIKVGQNATLLDGVYYAWPDSIDVNDAKASDAYEVTYANGSIVSIYKNSVSYGTAFELHDDEGIRLYVPGGRYTITETGSRSGGNYPVSVSYRDSNGNVNPKDGWDMPDGTENIKGSAKEVSDGEGISQVSATIDFTTGYENIVQTLTFTNMTSTIAIHKSVIGDLKSDSKFEFKVTLKYPYDSELGDNQVSPLYDKVYGYYVGCSIEDEDGIVVQDTVVLLEKVKGDEDENIWCGTIKLSAGQTALLATEQLDMLSDYNYYVEEVNIPNGYQLKSDVENPQSGVVSMGSTASTSFINLYNVPFLSISKSVVGSNTIKDNDDFEFLIKLSYADGSPVNGSYQLETSNGDRYRATFSNGEYRVRLMDGESLIIEGLPSGVSYFVEEVNLPEGKFCVVSSDSNGTLEENSYAEVKFTNIELVELEVKKVVDGEFPDGTLFDFTVEFSNSWVDVGGIISVIAPDGNEVSYTSGYSFKLSADDSIVFKGVPYGSIYTIQEASGGYSTSIKTYTLRSNGSKTLVSSKGGSRLTTGAINNNMFIEYINKYDDIPMLLPETGSTGIMNTLLVGVFSALLGISLIVCSNRKYNTGITS